MIFLFSHGGHTLVAALTAREGQELHVLLLSIYGCDALEVPVALAEAEGAEPSGSLAVVVVFAVVENVKVKFVGELRVNITVCLMTRVCFVFCDGIAPLGGACSLSFLSFSLA